MRTLLGRLLSLVGAHELAGRIAPTMCACGHGLHVHDAEADPCLCEVCGDNTRCDYADPETIAADRWDEGWIAGVGSLCPTALHGEERVLWALDHMPEDNPYRREEGCDCAVICSMGPTCPGAILAGLPGSGCMRNRPGSTQGEDDE